jgi:hypothetical protein
LGVKSPDTLSLISISAALDRLSTESEQWSQAHGAASATRAPMGDATPTPPPLQTMERERVTALGAAHSDKSG